MSHATVSNRHKRYKSTKEHKKQKNFFNKEYEGNYQSYRKIYLLFLMHFFTSVSKNGNIEF